MIKSGFSRRGAQGPQGPVGKIDSLPILLAANAWDENNEQTVTAQGVSASEVAQLIQPTPASASRESYEAAGVRCVAQGANSLTFSCESVPEASLIVYVAITELTQTDSQRLTFISQSDFTLATANQTKNWDGTLEYSADGENWAVWDGTTTLSSNNGYLALRGTGNSVITGDMEINKRWVLTGSAIFCSGSIENLLDYAAAARGEHPQMGIECFYGLFYQNSSLVTPPELPALTLSYSCYDRMFQGCTSLVFAPELPATTLDSGCYSEMFSGCTSLLYAPTLPAATLYSTCYAAMFYGCTSLVRASALQATTLGDACCYMMFGNCTALVTAPVLRAAALVNGCYDSMFSGCTSLKISATQDSTYAYPYRIPASGTGTDASDALRDMFDNTGGTFTGAPTINTTYYTDHEPVGA